MIPVAKIVLFELQLAHKDPTLYSTHFRYFGDVESPVRGNLESFHWCTHAETDSRLLLQRWSKLVQDKWLKSRMALKQKSTF